MNGVFSIGLFFALGLIWGELRELNKNLRNRK